ncbi:Oidioi.mRNA.OKI2018_I69.chr2.g5768.t1.cds [Oikopleura dioica]|uniref:Oidioi.mRNA.OKI2018_I69.chr2.g5768.t1.cds n=1 Tax=Oikopleura dioica TaxID=34765 RepID=A0ABN7T1G5_OIKDI|nr:Oidioi.mRNA.OKI2018_I69.chr2.g5768.t1.cds [Oikopleura dioica]
MISTKFFLFYQVSLGAFHGSRARPGLNVDFKETDDQKSVNYEEKNLDKSCPDADLQTECNALCRAEYNRCRLLCETEYCLSICDRDYQNCRDNCPCGTNCEEGCIDCDNPLCPTTTTMITTTIDQNTPNNVHILVFGFVNIVDSYIFSGDGQTIVSPNINAPETKYLQNSVHAIVKGELYIFGGIWDGYKIAKLNGCSFNELSIRLMHEFYYGAAAIDINDGERGSVAYSAMKKVETYNESMGWTSLPDHPIYFLEHTLIGLDNGAMLMLGGRLIEAGTHADIWQLKEDIWTRIGYLKESYASASALKIGDYIYLVSGDTDDESYNFFPVERIHLVNDDEISTEIIGGHEFYSYNPIVLEVTPDFCV